MKAEVVQYPGRAPRDNPHFVVTNLRLAPEAVYAIYRQRGDVENRHKELKDSLGLGRTSCPRFLANQVRVLLTATGARGRRPGRLTAAPLPQPVRTPAGVVSRPGPPACGSLPAHHAAPVGIGRHLGRVDLREAVRCDHGVYQSRATHVVRAFANKSG
jgi:hypothetical protein